MSNTKIAIIDTTKDDIGLKIIFNEECDYVNNFQELILNDDFEMSYDVIFIIIPLIYANIDKNGIINEYIKNKNLDEGLKNYYYHEWIIIIDMFFHGKIKTKKLCIIDNSDFDYCPINNISDNIVLPKNGFDNIIFLKKKMLLNKEYNNNIYPFIYIDKYEKPLINIINTIIPINNNLVKKIFFSGSTDIITNHDTQKRIDLLKALSINLKYKFVFLNKGLNENDYYKLLNRYAFNLDLLSNNFPNQRTFCILSTSGLRIGQREHYHNWGFKNDDNWAEETLFDTIDELIEKVNTLMIDDNLYNKCLDQQKYIKTKYFSIDSIKNYLLNIIL